MSDSTSSKIERLLVRAHKELLVRGDNKTYVSWQDLVDVIDYGGKVITTNRRQYGGSFYLHEVSLDNIIFVTTTETPALFQNPRYFLRT